MEDAATAEISRSQIWQWLRHGRVALADVQRVIAEEADHLGPGYDEARALFDEIATREEYVEFLTLPAYDQLLAAEHG
jgi:malate synthase